MKRNGFSLVEVLVAVAVLGLLAALGLRSGSETLARQRVEAATRRLAQGIERARAEAEEQGRPCGLHPGAAGWEAPGDGELDPCAKAVMALGEGVEWFHNLPPTLRFSSNGLALDGGTVVVASRGTELRRFVVMALPLGFVRLGRYEGAAGGAPDSAACRPDPNL